MKNTLSLNGDWRLAGFEEGQGKWAAPDAALPDNIEEIEAQVPGEVHVALLEAGRIPDPFYGTNADQVQWVEEKEWWYKRTFDVDEDFVVNKVYLEFDGLDTYATVYLNGQEIARTDNMFIPHRFDVTGVIQVGPNTVAVKFDPAAKVLGRLDCSPYRAAFDLSRVHSRKMQCGFGWDWTHRLVGAGLWRDVRLVSYDRLSIANVNIETEIEGGYANAWVTIEVENYTPEDQPVTASVVVSLGYNRETIELTDWVTPFGGVIEGVVRIEEPQLWWPNGFGEQPLYSCMAGLQVGAEVQDVAETRFGVRTVKFIERDEQGNPRFTLLVNDQEVFCKGGNWVPADHLVSRVTRERYYDLISLARDANFNMLRIWGGGIYESPHFYQACDEMGIMVWQDFMFSCATYPEDEAFCGKVATEAEWAIKQLRNHPSVVVWSGNNECDMGLPPDAEWLGKKLFHEIIPNVLARLDRTRPYRPSCPYGGEIGNAPTEGDWHRSSWFTAYQGDVREWRHMIEKENGLFVSEFVTQGPPMMESIRQFIPEDKLWPLTNEMWEYHNKDNPHSCRTDGLTHQQILENLVRRMMGEYHSAEEFAAWGGILQGEFMREEIEHYRREKWAISGALSWMYNDCWPAVGWSIVDYYLRPKAAYYYNRRAFDPVIVSFKQLQDRVQAYVTSDDRLHNIDGTLHIGVYTFGAYELLTEGFPVKLAANSSGMFWESPKLSEVFADPKQQCLVAVLEDQGKAAARNIYFPLIPSEMEWPLPKLLVHREQIGEGKFRVFISSDDYARNVQLVGLPIEARATDNFFDILPGEQYQVIIENTTQEEVRNLKPMVWRK